MPDEDQTLLMVSQSLGVSPNKYLVTRTRHEFERDARGFLKSKFLMIEIVSGMLGASDSKSKKVTQEDNEEFSGDLIKSGPEMSDSDAKSWAQRERKSSKAYPWLKKSGRRNYNVINLDTRDPNKFMEGIRRFGR